MHDHHLAKTGTHRTHFGDQELIGGSLATSPRIALANEVTRIKTEKVLFAYRKEVLISCEIRCDQRFFFLKKKSNSMFTNSI